MRLVLALFLAAAATVVLGGPVAGIFLQQILPLSPRLLLSRALPLLAMSLVALPAGALAAAGLAGAPRTLRLGICGLLAMGLLAMGVPSKHATFAPLLASLAIVMLVLTPRLASLDPVLLEAAAASGASPWNRLVLIVLPGIAWPSLAAFLLCILADVPALLSAG